MKDEDSRYEAVRSRDARFDGVFFFAVETTGVYCRPSCPAVPPKRHNVRFFAALLGPLEDGAHAPAGPGAGGAHLPLPAVETASFLGGAHACGDRRARILGPQPPGPRFEGVAHGGGQFGLALGVGGEAGQDGGGEGAQARVVVPQGQLVERPGPVGAVRGVPAQQVEGVPPAVGGEVAEDGEGQAGAGLVGVEHVLGVEEVRLHGVESAVQVEVEPGVVEGAVLHLPVVAGVAQHTVVQGRERLGARGRQRVQRAVATAALEQPEQGAAGRYDRIEHGKQPHIKRRRNR